MLFNVTRGLVLALLSLLSAQPAFAQKELSAKQLSISQLESKLEAIDAELATLAHYSLRSGAGTIGYRSRNYASADREEWLQIDFDHIASIDEIVLVPCVRRDSTNGFQGDAFPTYLEIWAGQDSSAPGTLVTKIQLDKDAEIRLAPLIIPMPRTQASWIRLVAKNLPKRYFDKKHVLQFSEILVFQGTENIALHAPIQVPIRGANQDKAGAWNPPAAVDGSMPYLMDSRKGEPSLAYVSKITDKPEVTLILDLKKQYPISRIQIHTVDQSTTIPQAYPSPPGMPTHLIIEGAKQADFSDAVTLLDHKIEKLNDISPIRMWAIPETDCRYVRIEHIAPDPVTPGFRIGFAEIELFSQGENVALHKPFTIANKSVQPLQRRPPSALTDGRNAYGEILPLHVWLQQLARRHELEAERPLIAGELQIRYSQQKKTLNRLTWLAGLLVAGIVFFIVYTRYTHQRDMATLRTRFAADLHDELGAHVHTIGILSNLADNQINSPDTLRTLHQRIGRLVQRTNASIRNCTDMLQATELYQNLNEDMERFTQRILADVTFDFHFEGKEYLTRLRPRQRIDLFLFYKECLVNISRHSEATTCKIDLHITEKNLTLQIEDNGIGLEHLGSKGNTVPPSLTRRAKLFRAKVSVNALATGGCCVILNKSFSKKFFRF